MATSPAQPRTTVFKSASTGVLRPMNVRGLMDGKAGVEEADPVQAVLNRNWSRPMASQPDGEKDDDAKRKKATRRSTVAAVQECEKELDQQGSLMKGGLERRKTTDPSSPGTGVRSRPFVVDTKRPLGGGSLGTGSYPGQGLPEEDDSPVNFCVGDSQPNTPTFSGAHEPRVRRDLGSNRMPARRYSFDIAGTGECDLSPKLRDSPRNRRATAKLLFGDKLEPLQDGDNEEAITQRADEKFETTSHKLQGFVSQTCVRMNDMLVAIRARHAKDATYLKDKVNFEMLVEVEFMVATANYYMGKWSHQLDPRKATAPLKPTMLVDSSTDDILSQAQGAVSRMEVLSGKLVPLLAKIISDAKTMRRGPNGEPLSPSSKHSAKLAHKRGLCDVEEIGKLAPHLEQLLDTAQSLAHLRRASTTQSAGSALTVMMAANKFKAVLEGNRAAPPPTPQASNSGGAPGADTPAVSNSKPASRGASRPSSAKADGSP